MTWRMLQKRRVANSTRNGCSNVDKVFCCLKKEIKCLKENTAWKSYVEKTATNWQEFCLTEFKIQPCPTHLLKTMSQKKKNPAFVKFFRRQIWLTCQQFLTVPQFQEHTIWESNVNNLVSQECYGNIRRCLSWTCYLKQLWSFISEELLKPAPLRQREAAWPTQLIKIIPVRTELLQLLQFIQKKQSRGSIWWFESLWRAQALIVLLFRRCISSHHHSWQRSITRGHHCTVNTLKPPPTSKSSLSSQTNAENRWDKGRDFPKSSVFI